MEKYNNNNKNRGSRSYPNKKNDNRKNYIDYNKELLKISKLNIDNGDVISIQMNDDNMKVSDIKRFIDLIPIKLEKDIRIIVTPKDIELRKIDEEELDHIIERLIDIRESMKKEGTKNEIENN